MQHILPEEYVAPEQFFTLSRESQLAWNGERHLLLAVLEQAIHEFFKYRHAHRRRGQRLFKEVVEWIWSQNHDWLYSFESICAHLDLDPGAIRQRLQDDEAGVQQSSCSSQTPRHTEIHTPTASYATNASA